MYSVIFSGAIMINEFYLVSLACFVGNPELGLKLPFFNKNKCLTQKLLDFVYQFQINVSKSMLKQHMFWN